MPRIERTDEERRLFYMERINILNALTEVQDYNPEEDEDLNKKAMMALTDTLEITENLVNICGNLAGLAVRQGEIRMGPEKEAPQRLVTLKDMRVLGAALRSLMKGVEAKTPKNSEGRPEQTPDIIRVRKALSRVTPVQLFYRVVYGGLFRYTEMTKNRNDVSVVVQRERYFGGIPEKERPVRMMDIKRGENLTEKVGKVDLGIYPENAERIYSILVLLERMQPVVDLPVKPGGNIVSRQVSRAGEAEFFLRHLPRGLKPWAETEEQAK